MNLRNQKGINMITLSVAVLILIIITSVLVYNSRDGVKVKGLNNLYNDIEELNSKVSTYYVKNGDIPKGAKYENEDFLNLFNENSTLEENQKNPNNGEDFYVINLKSLEGISLNYGRDYDNISSKTSNDSETNSTDIYVINMTSHTIYYPKGVKVKNKTYYTQVDNDWTSVTISDIPAITITEFKIEGTPYSTPPIPNGYYYVGGAINTGYVISDNANDENKFSNSNNVGTNLLGNQFVWVPVEKNQKITLRVNCTEDITEMKLYDPFGDEINLGTISGKTYENTNITPTVNGGYYLKITTSSLSKTEVLGVHSLFEVDTWSDFYGSDEDIDYEVNTFFNGSIEEMLNTYGYSSIDEYKIKGQEWMKIYSEPTDTINYAERVATNGGFYIGRYEATYGASGPLSKAGTSTRLSDGIPLTDGMIWNYIDQPTALSTAKAFNTNLKSSLLTGSAWDRTLGWLYETGNKTAFQISADSKEWGNFINDTFSVEDNLINTGTFSQTKANNIYDLAGNVNEWTTEKHEESYRVRGGAYISNNADSVVVLRGNHDPSMIYAGLGFRIALYL